MRSSAGVAVYPNDGLSPVQSQDEAQEPMARTVTADIAKTHVTTPSMAAIIIVVVGIAAAWWSIRSEVQLNNQALRSDVQLIRQALEFETRMREADKETYMQAFKTIEAKIGESRNGSAALSAMQELERLRADNAQLQQKLRGR